MALWLLGLGPPRGRGWSAAPPLHPPRPTPSPTPFSTRLRSRKRRGRRVGKCCSVERGGRTEGKKKKKKGTETWPSAVWKAVPQAALRRPAARKAGLLWEKAPRWVCSLGRYPAPRQQAVPLNTSPLRRRRRREGRGGDCGSGRESTSPPGPARPCPALSWALRPRSRRFHAPERGCVWVALKEEQAAGESALKGLLRRIPACAPWARAPERGGHRAGSYSEVGSSEGLPGWGARAGGEWRGVAFPA